MPNWKKVIVSGSDAILNSLNLTNATAGATVFSIDGTEGRLFSITDELSGSLFAVSDISGIPSFEVFSDDTVKIGTHNSESIVVSGSELKLSHLSTQGSETDVLTINGSNVVGTRQLSSGAFASAYSLPLATSSTRGGAKIGYSENGKNYPVELSSEKMYVNVPWTDTNTQLSSEDVIGVFSAGENITISDSGEISATDTNTDTNTVTSIRRDNTGTYRTGNINLVGGSNVTISESPNGTFTFASTDTNTDTNTTYLLKAAKYDGANSNPYLHLDANSGTDDYVQLSGGGATTVTRNSDGQITISSTDNNTQLSTAQVRSKLSAGTGISYDSSTGVITCDVVNTDTNTVDMGDGFKVQDGDGTNVTITENKYLKFKEGESIDINFTDTDGGGSSDPFDLTFSLKTAGVGAGTYGSTANGTKIDQITVDAYGRVTNVTTGATGTSNSDTQLSNEDVIAVFSAGENITISDSGEISATDTNTDTNTQNTYSVSVPSSTTKLRLTGAGHNGSTTDDIEFAGSGATTVTRTNDSKLTISSTDTNTQLSTAQVRAKISAEGLVSYDEETGVISTSANNYTLPAATATTKGGVELFSNTVQSTAANSVSSTASRTYGVQLNSAGQAVVNVPWTRTRLSFAGGSALSGDISLVDGTNTSWKHNGGSSYSLTATNTTYTADGNYGLTLSGTTFRLEDDRRRNSTSTDIKTGNTHDYTWYDADVGIRWYVAGVEDMRLQNGGTLQVDGDVVAFSTTISDERLKDNVATIENPLDKIKALRGVEYDWNAGSRKGKRDLGLIAQEVEKVIPNIVHEHEQPFLNDDEDDKTLYKTVDYEKMVAVLIEGMKEQQSQIDELKSEINQLKGKV